MFIHSDKETVRWSGITAGVFLGAAALEAFGWLGVCAVAAVTFLFCVAWVIIDMIRRGRENPS